MSNPISYLDHAATTPLDPRVLERMLPFLGNEFGNASSVHSLGRKARFAVEDARDRMAGLLGVEPGELIFTSGATEANNLALVGALREGADLLTSAAEHDAVLGPAQRLLDTGHTVQILNPDQLGSVSPRIASDALSANTGLVSLMFGNNEVGTLTDVATIIESTHRAGALFHCDATQAIGFGTGDLLDEADLISGSAHKFYGPKGAGFLAVRGLTTVEPLVLGGGQERKRRGGTENVAALIGMAVALELARENAADKVIRISGLRDRLRSALDEEFGTQIRFNTPDPASGDLKTLPHILNISFPSEDPKLTLDGEMLLLNMDMEGVLVSNGSACASGTVEPSHVLLAMGLSNEEASAALRFSLGVGTTEEDIDRTVSVLKMVLARMDREVTA